MTDKLSTLRDLTAELLSSALLPEDELGTELEKRGVTPCEGAAVVFALLKKARGGDISAAKLLRDLLAEEEPDSGTDTPGPDGGLTPEKLAALPDAALYALLGRERGEADGT